MALIHLLSVASNLEELQENISSELLSHVVGFKEYIYTMWLFYVRGYEKN